MQLEIVGFGEGSGLHGNELLKGLAVVQFGQLRETHSKKFIFFKLRRFPLPKGIQHVGVLPFGCYRRIRLFIEVVLRQKTIQFGEACIVSSQGHIQLLVAIADIHAHHRLDSFSPTFHHKVSGTHRRVDVGQRQDMIPQCRCPFHKVLDGHRAIAQAVI